jgi:hypothetical protein
MKKQGLWNKVEDTAKIKIDDISLALRIDKGSDKIKMRNQILTVDLALVKPH